VTVAALAAELVTIGRDVRDAVRAALATRSGRDGPTGGDGSTTISQGAGSISAWSTSMDENMNIVCPPPSGPWTTNSPTSPGPDARCPGWKFVNSYTVTVAGTFTKDQVSFPLVHNSPAKPLTCPTTPGDACNLSITKWEVKDKQVKITVKNNGTVDTFLTALTNIQWPSGNGKLTKIKLDGDVIYDNPDIPWTAGGVPTLGVPPLIADPNKRKIGKGSSDVITFEFERTASTNLAVSCETDRSPVTGLTPPSASVAPITTTLTGSCLCRNRIARRWVSASSISDRVTRCFSHTFASMNALTMSLLSHKVVTY